MIIAINYANKSFAKAQRFNLESAKKFGADKIVIEAQTYVRSMYDKLGFVQTSDEFLDHGIPHIKMELEIN